MNSNNFPYSIKLLDPSVDEKIKTSFLAITHGVVEVGPKKYVFTNKYPPAAEVIYNFKVRTDDVWVVTYPRSGTTLLQEMVWMIVNEDYDAMSKVSLIERVPFLESFTLGTDDATGKINHELGNGQPIRTHLVFSKPVWEALENISGRRFIKSHLPFSLLPPNLLSLGAKVIYVARNPKDEAISRYHQDRSLKISNFVGDFETYWDFFENNLTPYSPYWEHLEEGWERRNEKNFLFLFYEDVTKDYKAAILKVSKFLEKDMNDEQISKLAKFLHIDKFRQMHNPSDHTANIVSVNGTYEHVRTGKTGNWKEYFPNNLNIRANKWIQEHYKHTTLRFPIDLF